MVLLVLVYYLGAAWSTPTWRIFPDLVEFDRMGAIAAGCLFTMLPCGLIIPQLTDGVCDFRFGDDSGGGVGTVHVFSGRAAYFTWSDSRDGP